MPSRSPLNVINNVSVQLKVFTLAELFYILQANAQLPIFDLYRVKRITNGLRYRYGGNQTNQQVATVISLMGDVFYQTIPVENVNTLAYISFRRLSEPIITPFCSVCVTCKRCLDKDDASERQVKIYWVNGTVTTGIVGRGHVLISN